MLYTAVVLSWWHFLDFFTKEFLFLCTCNLGLGNKSIFPHPFCFTGSFLTMKNNLELKVNNCKWFAGRLFSWRGVDAATGRVVVRFVKLLRGPNVYRLIRHRSLLSECTLIFLILLFYWFRLRSLSWVTPIIR